MVAIIKTSKSMRNIIHYNENKLAEKKAELIHSANFGKDTSQLTIKDKIQTFLKYTSANERTLVNSIHISLNFSKADKLNALTMSSIADDYMNAIGFSMQPYLVYQHHDSGHPHIHIVSTNIRQNGLRIPLHNIGRNLSEPARKEIEINYHLAPAEQQIKHTEEINLTTKKAEYGRTETKRAISGVLSLVIDQYLYTSLPEFNVVLSRYNVTAERGMPGSRTFKNRGLVFRIIDGKGKKIGVPIKASLFHLKPTLSNLEKKFSSNRLRRIPLRKKLCNSIDHALYGNTNISLQKLNERLRQSQIEMIIRTGEKGRIFGITYIDHETKAVFNGSDLGKEYSANAIIERTQQRNVESQKLRVPFDKFSSTEENLNMIKSEEFSKESQKLSLLFEHQGEAGPPGEFKQDIQRKKKKKKPS